jgi:hypothetical protein
LRRLVLIAPFGLFDVRELAGPRATRPDELPGLPRRARASSPPSAAPKDAGVVDPDRARGSEAAARLLWPTGISVCASGRDRIQTPTLVLSGGPRRIRAMPRRRARGPGRVREIAAADCTRSSSLQPRRSPPRSTLPRVTPRLR